VAVYFTTKKSPSVFAIAVRTALMCFFYRLLKIDCLAFRVFPVVGSSVRFVMRMMLWYCVRLAFSLVLFALLIFIEVYLNHIIPANRDYCMVRSCITDVANFIVGFVMRRVSMAVQIKRIDS